MKKRTESVLNLNKADAYLFTSDINVSYMTGFSGDNSEFLLVGDSSWFFTDSRYTQQAIKDIKGSTEIVTTNAQHRIETINKTLQSNNIKSLAIENTQISLEKFSEFEKIFSIKDYVDISENLLKIRSVKSNTEIKKIKIAAAGNEIVLNELLKIIKPNMTELDVRAELIYQINKQGMDCAFKPIVAAGKNSALPHATVSNNKLKLGDMLTLDFGCRYEGYCSDITRTFGIGNVDGKLKNIYDIVREAQESALFRVQSGCSAKDVDASARNIIKKHGYGEFYNHGTGHGVGLEIHELPVLNPNSKDSLLPGMVYTVEPGIYIPGLGGVRIEDMCIVGTGNLYSFSKDLILIQ